VSALALLRIETSERGTFGRLVIPGGSTLHTLELPWKDNATDISCIPPGIYPLRRRFSPKQEIVLFWIDDVPGRVAAELHIGNLLKDTLGCVLLGLARTATAIERSTEAFHRFMEAMDGVDETTIEITWATGLP
jgi:hypothetical protein